MVNVALDWKNIHWLPDDTWKKDTLPKLRKEGIDPKKLPRSVYVIRLNGDYWVKYPWGESPTLYIGEGNFNARINSHRKWTAELEELVGEFSFLVKIASPRVNNNSYAYQDCEAALLERFGELFGSAPLWNKQFESRGSDYKYSKRQMDIALRRGSGTRYKWAFTPMKSGSFEFGVGYVA